VLFRSLSMSGLGDQNRAVSLSNNWSSKQKSKVSLSNNDTGIL